MTSNNGLPRLGSSEAATKADPKTRVVAITDRGVSVVLRKPSVAMILDLQHNTDTQSEDAEVAFESAVAMVSRMLVEPTMSEVDLKAEVSDWSFDDWQTLQTAAMELAGLREEDERSARAEFQSGRS